MTLRMASDAGASDSSADRPWHVGQRTSLAMWCTRCVTVGGLPLCVEPTARANTSTAASASAGRARLTSSRSLAELLGLGQQLLQRRVPHPAHDAGEHHAVGIDQERL